MNSGDTVEKAAASIISVVALFSGLWMIWSVTDSWKKTLAHPNKYY
jgi:hypothetical protein